MALDKQALLSIVSTPGKPREVGPVPVWGDTAYIRRLTGNDRDAWDLFQVSNMVTEEDEKAGKGKAGRMRTDARGIRAFLVCLGLSDANGRRLFDDGEAPLVGTFDGEALDYLYDQIREYNGLSPKAQEGLEKNSEPARSGVSGSGSPES